jgi:hypothetical protein
MNDNADDRRGPRGRSRPRRVGLLVATVGVALLAAACGGARPAAAPSAHPGQLTAQQVDAFALCVRDHGVPGFYFSRTNVSSFDYNGSGLKLPGWFPRPSPLARPCCSRR